jgi:hypothetical protein
LRFDRNGQSVAVWDLSWATWATEALPAAPEAA